jgi:hypothetical protein
MLGMNPGDLAIAHEETGNQTAPNKVGQHGRWGESSVRKTSVASHVSLKIENCEKHRTE